MTLKEKVLTQKPISAAPITENPPRHLVVRGILESTRIRSDSPEIDSQMKLNEFLPVLKQAALEWMEDQAPTLGAALAYYSVFSLAPLLIISIAIAGLVFGREAAQGQIFDQLRGLLGDASRKAMQDMVQNASAKPATSMLRP